MTLRPFALGVALALAAGVAARADTLATLTGPTAELATPGFFDISFDAAAGVGDVTFRVDGYRTLDGGGNCCTDNFSLFLNGTRIFQGTWDLGGGGTNSIIIAPSGATADPHSNGFGQGGHTDVFVPLDLADGSNTLRFQYEGGDQGLGDEAWGLEGVTVRSVAPSSDAPEPAAWALMLIGFAGLGAVLRRRPALA